MRALAMRSTVLSHQTAIIKAGSLTTTREVAKEVSVLRSFSIWSKLERWESLISWCLMNWLNIKKIYVLKSHLLLFCATTMNHLSIWLWHVIKSGFYMTASDDQLSGWAEKFQSTSQSQTCTKKRSWSLFGGLLPIWPAPAFGIPVKPLHLRSMLSKSMRCTENYNAWSWHWSTEWT